MIGFLRFIGVINAAIWLGASVFFTLGVSPAFSSNEMFVTLGRLHAGAAAQVLMERYHLMHQFCAVVALFHLMAVALYKSKPIPRGSLLLVLGILGLSLAGAYWVKPRLKVLHMTSHDVAAELAQRQRAQSHFAWWHMGSQALNVIMVGGVLVHLVGLTRPPDTFRYQIRF